MEPCPRPIDGAPAPWMAPQTHPQHLVIEGVVAGEGAANGVYRLATEPLHLGTSHNDAMGMGMHG